MLNVGIVGGVTGAYPEAGGEFRVPVTGRLESEEKEDSEGEEEREEEGFEEEEG